MKTGALVATGAGLIALSVADAAYRLRDWGAADGEVSARLPGDDLVPDAAGTSTVAIRVAAAADRVWDAVLDAAVAAAGTGTGDLRPGTTIPLGTAPWAGRPRLVRLEPGRLLVLRYDPTGVVLSFHVLATSPGRCRLVARTRMPRGTGPVRVAVAALDPVQILLTRRLLRRVAARAEAEAKDVAGLPGVC